MKKATCLIFLFLFLSSLLYSQEKEKKQRWSLSGYYYPEYCFHFHKYSEQYFDEPWSEVMNNQLPKFGYSTGLMCAFKVNSWLGLKTGVSYSESGYIGRPELEYDQSVIVRHYSFLKYQTIHFPLKISLTTYNSNHFSMFCDLGIHPAAVFGYHKSYWYSADPAQNIIQVGENVYPITKANNIGCWSSLEYSCMYNVKRFSLGLSANVKINLIPYTEGGHLVWCKYYFYNTGGGINLGYRI